MGSKHERLAIASAALGCLGIRSHLLGDIAIECTSVVAIHLFNSAEAKHEWMLGTRAAAWAYCAVHGCCGVGSGKKGLHRKKLLQ